MDSEIAAQAARVMERADILGKISEEPGRLTRRFATPALREAMDTIAAWMSDAGMSVRRDNVGNLVGRYEGRTGATRTLLLGSHLDTVRDAGKYDGPLGVLVALACVERLHQAGRRLPYGIEVLAFADEEGLRYHTAYLGSKVVAGSFDPAYLELVDHEGISLANAIRSFGGNPMALAGDARRADDLLGYCEVHIEQGPVLEALDLPVGVVSGIAGQSRVELAWTGVAGHAGTVPMELRRDALCAAAEFIGLAEQLALRQSGLVATVGQIAVQPGASNVIPGQAAHSLDLRHLDDLLRKQMIAQLREQAHAIGERRLVDVTWNVVQEHGSVQCAPELVEILSQAIAAEGYPAHRLASGAGHDAVVMAELCPVGMLFVRCKAGISHNPAESVAGDDVAIALRVIERALELLGDSGAD